MKAKRPLNQYRGRISPRQTAEGINAATSNAERLATDAKLLLDAKRFPSAASLAILALEEIGKVSILRHLLSSSSENELRKNWQRYRRHSEKNFYALMPDLVRKGARKLHDFKSLFTEQTAADREMFDSVKQLGFYTDCCGEKAHWSIPAEVIDEKLAVLLVEMASTFTKRKDGATSRELELWVTHMGNGVTTENLLRWCAAMVAAGLKPRDYAENMRRFITLPKNTNPIH